MSHKKRKEGKVSARGRGGGEGGGREIEIA